VTKILVLAEDGLSEHDVARVADLSTAETAVQAHIVVPVREKRNRVVEVLDRVALGRLARVERGDPRARAQAALDASVTALHDVGVEATGTLVDEDPVDLVAAAPADEIWVFTSPHVLEESVHRDWASRLRQATDRPVLHVVSGTDRVVS
jgi:hypothetical protein